MAEELEALVRDEDRGHVAADGHERPVPEGDLAAQPGEDVEPDQRDEVHGDEACLARAEVREQRGSNAIATTASATTARARDGGAPHTRRTASRPKRPAGRTSSTPRMIASATGSRRSAPTKST